MSAANLQSVQICCSRLEDDRVTIRKKNEEDLLSLLRNQSVLSALDSASERDGDTTWTTVFKAALRYLQKEAVKLQSDDDKRRGEVTASVRAKRDNQIRTVSTLLKTVVRLAVKKKPHLKCEPVIDALLELLVVDGNRFTREHFGADAVNVLQRLIVHDEYVKKFKVPDRNNDRKHQLRSVVRIAFQLFDALPQSLEFFDCCRFLLTVLERTSAHFYSLPVLRDKFQFFGRWLCSEKLTRASSESQQAFLSATNFFITMVGQDCRQMVCRLGDECTPAVLKMCGGRQLHPFIRFFQLQVSFHHPKGAVTMAEGAYWSDKKEWMTCLYRLHLYLHDLKLQGTSLDRQVIDLIADVDHQIFNSEEDFHDLPVTQMSRTQMTQMSYSRSDTSDLETQPAKRRKVQLDYESLLDQVQNKQSPWLKVLKSFVQKYSNFIVQDEERFNYTVKVLSDLLQNSIVNDVKEDAFACLCVLVDSAADKDNWTVIFEATIHVISLNQCEQSGHRLLQKLLRRLNIDGCWRLYDLFEKGTLRCNQFSCGTLIALLQRHPIERTSNDKREQSGKRRALLQWVLERRSWEVLRKEAPALAATVLGLLQVEVRAFIDEEGPAPDTSRSLEDEILSAALIELTARPNVAESKENEKSSPKVIPTMRQEVNLMVIKQCDDLCHRFASADDPEMDLHEATLNTAKFMVSYAKTLKILKIDEEFLRVHGAKLRELMTKVTSVSVSILDKAATPQVVETFHGWANLFDADANRVLCYFVPHRLIDKAFDVLHRTVKTLNPSNQDDMACFDDFFEDATTSASVQSEEESPVQFDKEFNVISAGLRMLCKLLSFSDDLKQLVTKLLSSVLDVPELQNRFVLLVYTALESIMDCNVNGQEIHEIMAVYQKIAKTKVGGKGQTFDPDIVGSLLLGLKKLLPILSANGRDVDRTNFIQFIKTFVLMHKTSGFNRFSVQLQCILVDIFGCFAVHDPQGVWSSWEGRMHNSCSQDLRETSVDIAEQIPMSQALVQFIFHQSNSVRKKASTYVPYLFSINEKSASSLRKDFSRVHRSLVYLFNVEFRLQEEQLKEELSNRRVTLLQVLGSIAVHCKYLEREAVTGIILSHKDQKIPMEHIASTLQSIAKRAKTNLESYLAPMLSYILNEHLKMNTNNLKEFPWRVLNHDSFEDFVVQYQTTVVPIYLWRGASKDRLAGLATIIKDSPKQVISKNFAFIAAYWCPHFAAGEMNKRLLESQRKFDKALDLASKMHKLCLETLGEQEFDMHMQKNLPEIISQSLGNLDDSQKTNELFEIDYRFRAPNPPYTNQALLVNLVKFFGSFVPNEQPLFSFLVKSHADCLQKTIMNLCRAFTEQDNENPEAKLRSMHGLGLFLTIVKSEKKYLAPQLPFVVWYVVHALLHAIKRNSKVDEVIVASLKVLLITVQSLDNVPQTIAKVLLPICSSVQSTLSKTTNQNIIENGLELLTYLIKENAKAYPDEISKLDIFEHEIFEELNSVIRRFQPTENILSWQISKFVEAGSIIEASHRLHSLKILSTVLESEREDLISILDDPSPSEKTLICQLVIDLMDLTIAPNVDPEIPQLACKCLGDIGPSSVIKNFGAARTRDGLSLTERIRTNEVVSALVDLVISADHQKAEEAAEALKKIFRSIDPGCVNKIQLPGKFEYLAPFESKTREGGLMKIDEAKFVSLMDSEDIWWCAEDHGSWVKQLTGSLLSPMKGDFLAHCEAVCRLDAKFAEKILPLVIFKILKSTNQKIKALVGKYVRMFFSRHYNRKETEDVSAIRSMLGVVNYLRLMAVSEGSLAWGRSFLIPDIDYLHVAKAALDSAAYLSAVLYADLWCQIKLEDAFHSNTIISRTNKGSPLDMIYRIDEPSTIQCQRILHAAYTKLGDPDAIYGCGSNRLLNQEARIQHFVQEKKYFNAMLLQDSCADKTGLLSTLYKAGMYNVLNQCDVEDVEKYQYECAWRLGKWDTPVHDYGSTEPEYHRNHFLALQGVVKSDLSATKANVVEARRAVTKELAANSLESSTVILQSLEHLKTLRELETFAKVKETPTPPLDLLDTLRDDPHTDFSFSEPTRLQRCILLGNLVDRNDSEELGRFVETAFGLAEDAMENKRYQTALQCLERVKELPPVAWIEMKSQFYDGILAHSWKEKGMGILMLRSLIEKFGRMKELQVKDKMLYADILKTLGVWMYESKSESARVILHSYLHKSVELYESLGATSAAVVDAFAKLAKFSHDQYKRIAEYMTSKEFNDKQVLIKKLKEDSNALKKVIKDGSAGDSRKAMIILERHSNLDETEVERIMTEKETYLKLALDNYGKTLQREENNDSAVCRMISLWFANTESKKVNLMMSDILAKVPTHRFVALLPQLAARMVLQPVAGMHSPEFPSVLLEFMGKLAVEHPFHTLPVILALANSNADDDTAKEDDERTKAAALLLKKFKGKTMMMIIKEMDQTCQALIQLAYCVIPPRKGVDKYDIPKSQPLQQLKNLKHTPVLTLNIAVRQDKKYDWVPKIVRFSQTYKTVGGVTAPKKISCLGSDGKERPQLVKGKDDLRQDAVMQQVFALMNTLLEKNKETRKRQLSIRTYRVVPLSQRSGILEWCENTMPLKDYLIGEDQASGAHSKYFPRDMTAFQCRKRLTEAVKFSAERKLQVFKEICSRFHPVMHHFFHEHFPSPGEMHARRSAYTRSAATSSMVGYVLGLGDRHIQNILIDVNSAELVHIDLGVAFEQGRILPTPETIPFRLTRDIVAGFGATGVEGTFRRSCEATLRVLRENKDGIMTILEVLLFDPLYNWSLTPSKAFRIQFGQDAPKVNDDKKDAAEVNKMAERCLIRVQQKLNGFEEDDYLSIEGQVSALIQQARDPGRLCGLFPGWQPYV